MTNKKLIGIATLLCLFVVFQQPPMSSFAQAIETQTDTTLTILQKDEIEPLTYIDSLLILTKEIENLKDETSDNLYQIKMQQLEIERQTTILGNDN